MPFTRLTNRRDLDVIVGAPPRRAASAAGTDAPGTSDSVAEGIIPKGDVENLVVIVGVFIHWDAKDNDKIYQYNYEATKTALQRAMRGEPKIDEVLAKKDTVKHPFYK